MVGPTKPNTGPTFPRVAATALEALKPKSDEINAMEGFAIVVLGWVGFSAFGSLPFIISGAIPSVVDAFFETVSGFTTTGDTLLLDIEGIPKGLHAAFGVH